MTNLFTYGTLCVPEVMQAVIGHELPGETAQLPGYHCTLVEACVFPGIAVRPGFVVQGTLFRDVERVIMDRLDDYEAPFYERITVPVHTAGSTVEADAYVVPPDEVWRLSKTPWNIERFVREHLLDYLSW